MHNICLYGMKCVWLRLRRKCLHPPDNRQDQAVKRPLRVDQCNFIAFIVATVLFIVVVILHELCREVDTVLNY